MIVCRYLEKLTNVCNMSKVCNVQLGRAILCKIMMNKPGFTQSCANEDVQNEVQN